MRLNKCNKILIIFFISHIQHTVNNLKLQQLAFLFLCNPKITWNIQTIGIFPQNIGTKAMDSGDFGQKQSLHLLLKAGFRFFCEPFRQFSGNLAPQLPDMLLQLVDAIVAGAPQFLASGVQLIAELGVGLAQAFPEIAAMIPGLLADAVTAFFSVDWLSVGSQIIEGVCQGIWDAGASLFSALADLARQALAAAKSALGIGSPSKLFADEVGHWLPAGMAVGIEDNLQPITVGVDKMAASAVSAFDQATAPNSTMPRTAPAPVSSLDTSATGRQENLTAVFMLDKREFARAIFKPLQEVNNEHGVQLVIA